MPYSKEYWENNREKIRAMQKKSMKKYNEKIKNRVFNHYGTSCICCGESHIEFLTIDHINGGGAKHRRAINGRTYEWLVHNNFPEGFQTLCMNCNFSLGIRGYCPHSEDKEKK